jgi:hypothetical protein
VMNSKERGANNQSRAVHTPRKPAQLGRRGKRSSHAKNRTDDKSNRRRQSQSRVTQCHGSLRRQILRQIDSACHER